MGPHDERRSELLWDPHKVTHGFSIQRVNGVRLVFSSASPFVSAPSAIFQHTHGADGAGPLNPPLPIISVCLDIVSSYEKRRERGMEHVLKKALQAARGLDNPKRAAISRWCLGVVCWRGRLLYLLAKAASSPPPDSADRAQRWNAMLDEELQQQQQSVGLGFAQALLGLYLLDRQRAGDDLRPITSPILHDTADDSDVSKSSRQGESEAVAGGDVELLVRQYLLQGDERLWAWVRAAALVDTWPREAAASIASQYSLPQWLAHDLTEQYGQAEAEALAATFNTPGPVTLRANLLRCHGGREELIECLRQEGLVAIPTPLSPWGVRLPSGRPPTGLWSAAAWREGRMEVQDEGSQLAAWLTGAKRGQVVVDYCAGNGGKTLALASLMGGEGQVYVHDVDPRRLKQLDAAAQRAGAGHMLHRLTRARDEGEEGREDEWSEDWRERVGEKGGADVVLVDAPCSSSGVLRRHPSLRWTLSREEAHEQWPAVQRQVLREAQALVRPGGTLVYVTCSVLRRENQGVADWFTEAFDTAFSPHPTPHPSQEAELLKALTVLEGGGLSRVSRAGSEAHLSLLPHVHGTDGFFVARWIRKG